MSNMLKMQTLENGNIKVKVPMMLRIMGSRKRAIDRSGGNDAIAPLATHIARAFRWRKLIDEGKFSNSQALAAALKIDRGYVDRTLRLTLLAPEIVHSILNNTAPEKLTLDTVRGQIPDEWGAQKEYFKIKP